MAEVREAVIAAICECRGAPRTKEDIFRELDHPNVERYWWWWEHCPKVVTDNWASLSLETKLFVMLMAGTAAYVELSNMDD
jgi:hypothetical protein